MGGQIPQPPAIADDEPTGQRAIEAIRIINDAYVVLANAGKVVVHAETHHLFYAVFGWWARVNRSALLVAVAHEAGLGHESGPIVRVIMQHVLTMQWVIDVGDEALAAIDEHGDDNRRRLLVHMNEARWDLPAGTSADAPTRPDTPNPLKGTFSNFANLCRAYDAKTLYVPYSLLSAEIHPSRQGARMYIDETGTLHSQPVIRRYGLLIQTAMCVIQAARVVMPLLTDQEQLSLAVTAAEVRLGSQIDLPTLQLDQ